MNEITITDKGGRLMVSGLQVVTDFGKQHKDVIKSIENLLRETSAKNFANLTTENSAMKSFFIESTYADSYGRQQKCYDITRDGFSLLVMGFTGKKALEWKLEYIEAFNLIEQELTNRNNNIDKLIAKAVTSAVAETIKVMIPLIERNTPKPDYAPYEEPRHRGGDACGIIGKLEPALRNEVADMIFSDRYTYEEVKHFLSEQGVAVSISSIQRYKKRLYRK